MSIPEVTTHAIVLNQNRENVLLVNWVDHKGDKIWSFPGGHISFGETIKDALQREVKEETGYKIKLLGFMGVYDNIIKNNEDIMAHFINIIWIAIILNEENQFTKDCDIIDKKWFKIKELDKNYLTKNAASIFNDFLTSQFYTQVKDQSKTYKK